MLHCPEAQRQAGAEPCTRVPILRIAFVALSARGGTALYAAGLAKELSKSHSVLFIGPEHMTDKRLGRADFFPVSGLDTHLKSTVRALWPTSYSRIARALKRYRPDVIHFPLTHPWNVMAAQVLPSSPLIYTIHDPLPHEGARYVWWTGLTHRYFYRRARAVVCLSHYSQSLVMRMGRPREVVMIPHPCFTHYAALVTDGVRRSKVVFFGRIEAYKGVEYFVRAVEICAPKFPNVEWVIAGPGGHDLLNACGAYSGHISVNNRHMSEQEVADLLASAAVVILPYISSTQSGVVAAAYAAGCPVIATTVGGLPEVVQHGRTGLLVPPRDTQALARAITKILEEPAFADDLRGFVRQTALTELSWERVASDHERLYRRCITSK